MSIEIEDRTGEIRSPEEFDRALAVVQKLMLQTIPGTTGAPPPLLFLELPTILDALRLARAVAALNERKKAQQGGA